MSLHLGTTDAGEPFMLPLDAATRRLAILAMSGAGKSNAAVVLAEAMYDAGIPWVAIDPKGDWYGVRSSADGSEPGLPVPIFGGRHGDVSLEASAGKVIGALIVEQRLTCILDVSLFDNQDRWGFLHDLGETLLRQPPQVLHLFLEEAADYIPQSTREGGNQPKCLGTWQRIVKLGRTIGLGSTQITQRSASLNKDTLYMADCLVSLRTAGPGDIKTIKGWVEHSGAAADILRSLPRLEDGEAWVSSPGWLRSTTRIRFDRRRTYDSGSTPVMLEGGARPATLADVDLDAVREAMAATVERIEADDPKKLHDQIARLTKEVEAGRVLAGKAAEALAAPCDHKDTIARLTANMAGLREGLRIALRERDQRGVLIEQYEQRIEHLASAVESLRAVKDIALSQEKTNAAQATPQARPNRMASPPADISPPGPLQNEPQPGREDGSRARPSTPPVSQPRAAAKTAPGKGRDTDDMNDEEVEALIDRKLEARGMVIRVEVPAAEVIRHDYQRRAVERLMAKVDGMGADARECLRFMLGHGPESMTAGRLQEGLSGYKGGNAQVKWGKALAELTKVAMVAKEGSTSNATYRSNVRDFVGDALSPHEASSEEEDQVYEAVLGRIAGGGS